MSACCPTCGHELPEVSTLPGLEPLPEGECSGWTAPMIVEAMKRWARQFGEPPTSVEWNPAPSQWNAWPESVRRARWRRWQSGNWPRLHHVTTVFTSWNAAIEAAGFPALGPGHKRGERSAA